jgi:hypothetical protein
VRSEGLPQEIVAPTHGSSKLTERRPKAWRFGLRFGRSEINNSEEIGGHFHRHPISKSVIIVDVPIAIGGGEGRGEQQLYTSWATPEVVHFQRLIDPA